MSSKLNSPIFLFTFAAFLVAKIEAGGCGCGLPPPMSICPPPILPPPAPMCPPPPICPPPILPPPCTCPAPLPCPAPPPPQICPPPVFCPPPALPPPPSPCGGYQPQPMLPPQPVYTQPPPSNDCCCQCGGSQCKYRGRARTHGSRIFSALSAVEEDPTCNSEKLRVVIEENITSDPTISKRAIQKAAEERLFAKINVICGREDFSYVMYTDTYCQATSGDITCYAFRPLGMGSTSSNDDI